MNYQKLMSVNIKKLRQNNHLTQEEFAEKVGLSLQGLSNIERNRYQPTADTVDRICKAFDIQPAQLLLLPEHTTQEIIDNINTLLCSCKPKKLKQIYEIITIMLR